MKLDLTGVEPSSGNYEPMPAGEYLLACTDAELKDTRAGTGQFVKAEFTVKGPVEFENRKVWQNFNIQNPNEDAERIGKEQLASLLECAGVPAEKRVLKSVNQLCGLVVAAQLKIRKSDTYGDSNEIHYFKAADEFSAPAGLDKDDDFSF